MQVIPITTDAIKKLIFFSCVFFLLSKVWRSLRTQIHVKKFSKSEEFLLQFFLTFSYCFFFSSHVSSCKYSTGPNFFTFWYDILTSFLGAAWLSWWLAGRQSPQGGLSHWATSDEEMERGLDECTYCMNVIGWLYWMNVTKYKKINKKSGKLPTNL
jgi:hypothetical protein